MADGQAWTRQRILDELSRTSFGYQNVPLPHGLSTGGDDRSATARAIFEERMDGKSVFDLGCRFGYFCFFAEERGAARMLGAEVDPDYVRKSRLLADMKGSRAEFRLFDIETEPLEETFDYVLCLNVLHHLRNPLAALDRLIAATRERLVIETAGFAGRDRRKNGVWLWMVPLLSRLPVLLLARASSQTFFITTKALEVLLLEKRADIARVDVTRAGHKGRPILIAHRRRIRHLVVVAGLPAAGKSTLIEHLRSGGDAEMARRAGFDPALDWRVVHFGRLGENDEPDMGNVILHYNISGRMVTGDIYKFTHALPELMSVAERVTVLTLACPRKRLLAQFEEGRLPKARGLFGRKAVRKKMARLLELYRNDKALDGVYGDWLATVARWKRPHLVVKHDGAAYSVEEPSSLAGY